MSRRAVRIELDPRADAAYIALSDGEVVDTVQISSDVLVDLDAFGVVVGIEVLRLAAELPTLRLKNEWHVHSEVIDLLDFIRPDVKTFVASASSVPSRPSRTRAADRELCRA